MSDLKERILGGVSRETLSDLQRFTELFTEYAAHTNLVARSTLQDIWPRHILDSAQLLLLQPQLLRWLDLGSGGGFPGLIVAILLKERVGAHVDLIESTGKKAAFLQSVATSLSLPARVLNKRIEGLVDHIALPQAVSARALAPLPRLLEWASPWLTQGAIGLFHKGRNFAEEVQESRFDWDFHMLQHGSLTDSDAAILEIRNLKRK